MTNTEDDKDWRKILTQLDELHQFRRSMSHYSIYQGTYEKLAIELNLILVELTGFNYVEHKAKRGNDKREISTIAV